MIIITETREEANSLIMKAVEKALNTGNFVGELEVVDIPMTKDTVQDYRHLPEVIEDDKEVLAAYAILKETLE